MEQKKVWSLAGYTLEPGGKYRKGRSDPMRVDELIERARSRQLPKEVQQYFTDSLIRSGAVDVMVKAGT